MKTFKQFFKGYNLKEDYKSSSTLSFETIPGFTVSIFYDKIPIAPFNLYSYIEPFRKDPIISKSRGRELRGLMYEYNSYLLTFLFSSNVTHFVVSKQLSLNANKFHIPSINYAGIYNTAYGAYDDSNLESKGLKDFVFPFITIDREIKCNLMPNVVDSLDTFYNIKHLFGLSEQQWITLKKD